MPAVLLHVHQIMICIIFLEVQIAYCRKKDFTKPEMELLNRHLKVLRLWASFRESGHCLALEYVPSLHIRFLEF